MGRPKRAERRESRKATKRLRAFRVAEVVRLRQDCNEFRLSETVAVESMKREAAAIVGKNTGGRLHMERGQLTSITAGGWLYTIRGDSVQARKI